MKACLVSQQANFSPFQTGWGGGRGGGGGLVGCVQSRGLGARSPHLPRFILLVSFSDTLLAVLSLDIVYDCHLRPVLFNGEIVIRLKKILKKLYYYK